MNERGWFLTAMPFLVVARALVIMLAKNVGPDLTLKCAQKQGSVQRRGVKISEQILNNGYLGFVSERV
jgi:hypothetical protein